MREIRVYELAHDEPATAWRVEHATVLNVHAGLVWLTLEGNADDHWLRAGDTFELPRGAMARLSAERASARIALADAPARAEPRRDGHPWTRRLSGAWSPHRFAAE